MHRIEVRLKSHLPDARGQGLVKDIQDLGVTTVSGARVADIYWLNADLSDKELKTICEQVLTDPVTQEYTTAAPKADTTSEAHKHFHSVEVAYKPGVTDPVEASIMKAIRDVGAEKVKAVKTSRLYTLEGKLTRKELETISFRLLINPIVQHVVTGEHIVFPENPQYRFKLEHVDIFSEDKATLARKYGFSLEEFESIIAYYKKQKHSPTDVELETLAQTWSEHCVHKTFKGKVKLGNKVVDNLLKSTVMKATQELNKPWCLSVFMDNSGVIDMDGKWALCFKVETHNHPSAVEPYGGAATGIGGVVRDPLGTGLGAKPIANTDVFCFGPPDLPYSKLPAGVLHPRRMFKGVRAGVADYANRLGIPTLNGAILFDERYVANPLVYCGTLGLMPKELAPRGQQKPGDLVVLVGGRTGRDGIHGVTFASEQLTDASSTKSFSAVQIGNAIVEKKVIDVMLQARERGLYVRVTDVGGGGLSSAVGEMGEDTGVKVYLERVPLKYAGLTYSEIWVSESQERMILAVPKEHAEEFLCLFRSEDVDATVIGEFTNDKHLRLLYKEHEVGDLEMPFLHKGYPQINREAVWEKPKNPEPDFAPPADLGKPLLDVLGAWNVCSKEWVIRQYDHEVQGGNVLKPLVGVANDGPGDAAIIRPLLDCGMGAVISCGINSRYGDVDPYWMAASVIDEALRQIIAVGGDLKKVALLDNFCWGRTSRPEMLGALVHATQACYDMAIAYGTPFISGKDSLNNEFEYEGKIIAIPHTLLISALGVMEDAGKAISMDFKKAGNLIYIAGATYNEIGGSEYLASRGYIGSTVPKVNPQTAKKTMEALSNATGKGLVRACHDCSDGGLGVALAEMAFAGGLGEKVNLKAVPLGEKIERDDYIFFSESNSRFIIEIAPEKKAEFEKIMSGNILAQIGEVTGSGKLEVTGTKGKVIASVGIAELKDAWQKPLRW